MADQPLIFEVDPGDKFKKAVVDASKQLDDLTIPLTLISREWFKSNKAFFVLKSEGKFEDLSEKYKEQKERRVGFIYPVLKSSGALERSITNPSDPESINVIINKKGLVMGTRIPYSPFLHFGTKRMPARPFVMIGAEQTGPEEFTNRERNWVRIINDFVMKKLEPVGEVKK